MSNPDYNATTTGTEVAAALAGQIRGKNGEFLIFFVVLKLCR